jgi:hypothetical protein
MPANFYLIFVETVFFLKHIHNLVVLQDLKVSSGIGINCIFHKSGPVFFL